MLRFAAIGAVFLIGSGLMPLPASADVPAPGEKIRAFPGCPCPPVVHRRHVRVRHHRFVPPPPVAIVERDLYNVLIPSTYDPAYDRVVVDHFRTPPVTGFDEPWRPKPVWPGILPYRATAPEGGIVQYDGLTGEYIRLAAVDAGRVAAPMPLPPPPPNPWWPW
ncbi:MAG: hypothetical protein JO008_13085 [Alphaproteobacteria bacterium]|nr:hypothetical protein [Alphaproteobacteria bacterium]